MTVRCCFTIHQHVAQYAFIRCLGSVVRCISVMLGGTRSTHTHHCLLGEGSIPVIFEVTFHNSEQPVSFQRDQLYHNLSVSSVQFCDFWLKAPFISETVRDRPMVTMKR